MRPAWTRALAAARLGARRVLGMNQRNLRYIYAENPRRHFPLADDKLRTKEALDKAGIPLPATLLVFSSFYELRSLEEDLVSFTEFVIKPAQGSGGGGIVVVTGRDGDRLVTISGRRLTFQEVRKHLADIIFGVYSFDLTDRAVVEERLVLHPEMARLSPMGLADQRILLHRGRPLLSMTRLPTSGSGGRANLHQGAVGVGVDISTGRSTYAVWKGRPVAAHPDTGEPLLGRLLPDWKEALEVARRAAAALPLGYLGVDLALTPRGPVLLEVNVRPGLEIQNANRQGLRALLEGGRTR